MKKTKIKTKSQAIIILMAIAIGVAVIGHAGQIKTGQELSLNYPDKTEETREPEPSMQEWVLNRIEQAGLNKYEAYMIVQCESGWDDYAYGFNNNGTSDLGLWQINSIHKDTIEVRDRFDYKKATEWAIQKRLKDGNWSAWYCAQKLGIN